MMGSCLFVNRSWHKGCKYVAKKFPTIFRQLDYQKFMKEWTKLKPECFTSLSLSDREYVFKCTVRILEEHPESVEAVIPMSVLKTFYQAWNEMCRLKKVELWCWVVRFHAAFVKVLVNPTSTPRFFAYFVQVLTKTLAFQSEYPMSDNFEAHESLLWQSLRCACKNLSQDHLKRCLIAAQTLLDQQGVSTAIYNAIIWNLECLK